MVGRRRRRSESTSSKSASSPHRVSRNDAQRMPISRSELPSAAVGHPPTSSSELDVSGLNIDTEAEMALDEALQDPDLMVVGGIDQHSDSPAPSNPTVERALDDALRGGQRAASARRRRWLLRRLPRRCTRRPCRIHLARPICRRRRIRRQSTTSLTRVPGSRTDDRGCEWPTLWPPCERPGSHVEAAADRLEEHYQVDSGGEALQTILICMHASRQDVIRQLRDEAVRLRMAGANSEVILWAAFGFFDSMLGDQSTF